MKTTGTRASIKLAVGTLLLIGLAAAPASAQTAKPGKWEYTVTTQMANMPQLPAGVQLPPGVKLPPNIQLRGGPGGMSVTRTTCVTASDPTAELRRPHGPNAARSRCKIDKMERRGGAVSWATTCTVPDATVHSEGTAQYAGDSMEASIRTTRVAGNGAPIEVSNRVVGRYLGPCNAK